MRTYKSSQELRKIKTTGSQAAWVSSKRNTLSFISILGKGSKNIVLFKLNGSFSCLFFTHPPWCVFITSQDIYNLGAALYINCWRSPTTAVCVFPKVFSLRVAEHTFSEWLIVVLFLEILYLPSASSQVQYRCGCLPHSDHCFSLSHLFT